MIEFRLGDRVTFQNPGTGTKREGVVRAIRDDGKACEMWVEIANGMTLIVINHGQESREKT